MNKEREENNLIVVNENEKETYVIQTTMGNSNSNLERINDNIINNFTIKFLFLSLIIFLLTLVPEYVILHNYENTNLIKVFDKLFMIVIPPILISSSIIIYSYIKKDFLLNENSNAVFILYSVNILITYILIVIFSFKYVKILISISILLSVVISLLLLMNTFTIFYDKTITKLTVMYSYCFLHFIFHLIYFKENFVEFFTIIVFFFIYFAYLNSELKWLVIDYVRKNNLNRNESVSMKVVITCLLISPMDMILTSFK